MSPETHSAKSTRATPWRPPAEGLVASGCLWRAPARSPISYPDTANDAFLTFEERSYWFRHRLACLLTMLERFPPGGEFYDLGGGNGFIAAALNASGYPSVLVEPGSGALNAVRSGLPRVVHATLEDAGFRSGSLPAAGAFDVLEHIADDVAFLHLVRDHLPSGGRFYCTVPAMPALWSHEDACAGHFRRYRPDTLARTLRRAGFTLEFVTPIFAWLVVPLFLFRTLPSRLTPQPTSSSRWSAAGAVRDHTLPPLLAPLVAHLHAAELRSLAAGRPLACGTSLLAVARAP